MSTCQRRAVLRKIAARQRRAVGVTARPPLAMLLAGGAAATPQRGRVAMRPGPRILTPREIEVLRLVATGETDRGIADTLYVSRRTVSSHVSNILAKLDVPSRWAAVVAAARIGLL